MFLRVHFQRSFSSETSNTGWIMTNEFFYSSMRHQEMVDHLLVESAVDSAERADRLPSVSLHVLHQMQSEDVRSILEALEADAAASFLRSCRRLMFDFDAAII